MIHEVTFSRSIFGRTYTYIDKRSDFKDGEQPMYTGFKRKYRKAKYSTHDYWTERTESISYCWKDQRGKGRNKRTKQYRRIPTIELYDAR